MASKSIGFWSIKSRTVSLGAKSTTVVGFLSLIFIFWLSFHVSSGIVKTSR